MLPASLDRTMSAKKKTQAKKTTTRKKEAFASTLGTANASILVNVSADGVVSIGILRAVPADGSGFSALNISKKEAAALGSMLVKAAKIAQRDGESTAYKDLGVSEAESFGKVLLAAAQDDKK